jgi:hypothetical protein
MSPALALIALASIALFALVGLALSVPLALAALTPVAAVSPARGRAVHRLTAPWPRRALYLPSSLILARRPFSR